MTPSLPLPPTPCYIVDETALCRNCRLVTDIARRAGVKIILALKANALWPTFDIIAEYNRHFTASSPNELMLGAEYLGGEAHVYSPAYTDADIDAYLSRASHITFNSLSQFERYGEAARRAGVSVGLRVNTRCSQVETDLYNPSLPGTRFGVAADKLRELPEGIDGLHFHALCEGSAAETVRLIEAFEQQFGHLIPSLKWVNMGGGHLMTRAGYDVDMLVDALRAFRERHPGLEVILEPGSAWTWRTGSLDVSVVDVVEDSGIPTAIIDASFACHMPDCLEMPYKPACMEETPGGAWQCRLGGNSCLSGDWVDGFTFDSPLTPGRRLTLEDMNHYTTVKTTMFNGINHPSMVLRHTDGTYHTMRRFTYADYKSRMG